MHHHTTQINQPTDAAVSQVNCLTFMCGSTCFGRFLAHHHELTIALAASGSTVRTLLVSGLAYHDAHRFGPQYVILLTSHPAHILIISVPKVTFVFGVFAKPLQQVTFSLCQSVSGEQFGCHLTDLHGDFFC
jgi:hypothetical protein